MSGEKCKSLKDFGVYCSLSSHLSRTAAAKAGGLQAQQTPAKRSLHRLCSSSSVHPSSLPLYQIQSCLRTGVDPLNVGEGRDTS